MSHASNKIERHLIESVEPLSTPCYVYSVSEVEKNYHDLKSALGTQLIYSLKANSNLDLLVRCGHVFVDGIEMASIGELNLLANGKATRYINNPSADKAFIRAAIASKCVLVIDNIEQINIVAEFIGKRPLNAVVLRINHEVLDHYIDRTKKSRPNHFGFDISSLKAAIIRCAELGIKVQGIHVFQGSDAFNDTAMLTAQSALSLVKDVENWLGYPLTMLNLGGGFSSNWREGGFDFSRYRSLLSEFPNHINLVHESGRGIVASAGYFLTSIRYIKKIDQRRYAICDGGMAQNFLLAKTETAFKRYQEPKIFSHNLKRELTLEETSKKDNDTYLIVGTSCNKDDIIGQVTANSLSIGDTAVFANCGAYHASYRVAPFLHLPDPKTYIVE